MIIPKLLVVIVTRIIGPHHKAMLNRCVESVINFIGCNQSIQIVIVDSDSLEKSYMNDYANNEFIHIEDIANTQYEGGAWHYAFRKYYAERYLFIHDSCEVLSSIDYFLENEILAVQNPMNSWDSTNSWHVNKVTEWIANTEWKEITNQFTMVQGSIFYAHRSVLEHLDSMGFYRNLPSGSPTGKGSAEAYERYLGMALTLAGYEQHLKNNRLPIRKMFMGRD